MPTKPDTGVKRSNKIMTRVKFIIKIKKIENKFFDI